MGVDRIFGCTFALSLALSCAGNLYSQIPGQRQPGNRQMPVQAAPAQTFSVGDAVQIQAADGSWIQGSIRNIDPANGKYEVALVNGMSGWAAPTALRKVAGAGIPQPALPPVPVQAIAPAQPGPAAPSLCAGQPACTEVRDFAVTISNFRLSNESGYQILDVTLRFANKTGQALAIGYVDGSAGIVDERGNRYAVRGDNTIRGIGIIRGNAPDAKFIVQAGDSGNAQFQFFGRPAQNIVGSAFQLDLTVRELTSAGASQYTLGAEFPLEFPGIGQTTISAAPVSSTQAGPAAPQPGMPAGQQLAQAANPQAAPQAAGQPPAAAQSKARRGLFGLSQAAGAIPGLSQATGTAAAASAQATAPQGAAAGVSTMIPQLAAFATPGQTGTAASTAQTAASMIPAFTGAGQNASGIATQAAAMIPGFSPNPAAAPAGAAPAATNYAAPGVVPPAAVADPCAGRQHCFNAGTFAADVIRLTGSSGANNDYTVRALVMFRNNTAQPVALGYLGGSGVISDNAGNRYAPTLVGAADQTAQGIGLIQGAQADGRFLLAPGRNAQATFVLTRRGPTAPTLGAAFNLNVTLAEVVAAGNQIRPGAQHSIALANLTCSCAPAATAAAKPKPASAAGALRNALGTKK